MAKEVLGEAPFEENHKPESLDYSDKEIMYRGFLIRRMVAAKNARDQEHTEFDDMDYETYYETNAKAAYSYIAPKKNKEETRVVTGTTREKEHTMLSTLLNFNFQPSIIAFDDSDTVVTDLGGIMTDLVKKSRQLEEVPYDDARALIYKEMLDQGTCFVEDVWVEPRHVEKTLENFDFKGGVNVDKIKWKKNIIRELGRCETNLFSGTKVFLGNVKEFFINKQPFIFTAERITWEQARLQYGDWDRFKYVPKTVKFFGEVPTDIGDSTYRNWTLFETEESMVEVLKYQDKDANEYMLMLNGVMMLPAGFPLTAVSPSGEYTIAKGDSEPISRFFAYSKSIPAKTKVDQQVLDEFLKLFILKTQKSLMPPFANNTGRVLSKDIFLPAKIVSGIDPNKLQPIGDVQPVSQAEFALFEMVKRIIDEKSVSPVVSGDITGGNTTATEILESKRQAMLKMGFAVVGTALLENRLTWLRIHNILHNWTKPIDERISDVSRNLKSVFRKVSVETQFEDGAAGIREIEFNPTLAGQIQPQEMMNLEEFLSAREGRTVRKVFLNPELLRKVKLKWYVTNTPTEKDSSELKKAMFMKNVSDAMTLFGPQSVNLEALKTRFAGLIGEDPKVWFVKGVPSMPVGAVNPNQMQRSVAQGVALPNMVGAGR